MDVGAMYYMNKNKNKNSGWSGSGYGKPAYNTVRAIIMAIQPIAMQGQPVNVMLPSEALYKAAKTKSAMNENALF